MSTEEYNDIPVFFCKRCLSLRIKHDEFLGDYCPDCGSTDIEENHIDYWLALKKMKEQYK